MLNTVKIFMIEHCAAIIGIIGFFLFIYGFTVKNTIAKTSMIIVGIAMFVIGIYIGYNYSCYLHEMVVDFIPDNTLSQQDAQRLAQKVTSNCRQKYKQQDVLILYKNAIKQKKKQKSIINTSTIKI